LPQEKLPARPIQAGQYNSMYAHYGEVGNDHSSVPINVVTFDELSFLKQVYAFYILYIKTMMELKPINLAGSQQSPATPTPTMHFRSSARNKCCIASKGAENPAHVFQPNSHQASILFIL